MNDTRLMEMVRKMRETLLDYGPARSRLLIRVTRALAQGFPISETQVNRIAADIGIERGEAHSFLRQITERNTTDDIVGIMGLSLNDHPHRLHINGVTLSAWCAEDTLFLPAMLKRTATVESYSPVSKEKIWLTISPERVETVNPAGAVISVVVVDPQQENMASVEAIWNTFCEHIHFFASREEAERWATDRHPMAILTVDEGFELGQQLWSKVLSYAQ